MRVDPRGPLADSLAREVAVRAGIPVLVTGSLQSVGDAYQLSVRLVDSDSSRVLLTHTETAESEEELITADGAVDRLTGHLRERIGESLRSVRQREPLPLVTTSSLEALKLFARARGLGGAERQAALEAAVELDPDFGMAWRGLASSYGQTSEKGIMAFERAFEVADRLSEQERLYVTGAYYLVSNIDYEKSAEANRRLAARYPDYSTGWVNLSQALYRMGAYEEYQEVCLRAIEVNVSYNTTWNLWDSSLLVRDTANAWRAIDLAGGIERLASSIPEWEAKTAYMAGDYPRARRHLQEWRDLAGSNGSLGPEVFSLVYLGILEGVQGRRSRMEEEFRRGKELLGTRTLYGWLSSEYLDYILALGEMMVLDLPDGGERSREALDAWEAGFPPDHVFALGDALEFAENGRPDRAQEILDAWEARTPERVRRASGTRADELAVRGEIARAEGRIQEGFDFLRAASDAGTTSVLTHGILAWAYDQSGMADSALVAYRRYVEGPHFVDRLNYDHLYLPVAYERLGQLHEGRGELEEAAKYYRLFVDLWANADPELQPRVQAAREALERVEAGR
jgi:tetratricopeptide (TPR) repeat protein